MRETETRSREPSNTARKAARPHAIAERPAAFVTHGTVPKFNGEVPREHQHPEVAWVLHGAPGLEAAVCHPVEFVPDPAEERGLRLPHDEDITKLDARSRAIAASFGVRAEHTWVGAKCPPAVALRGWERARSYGYSGQLPASN